MSKVRQPYIYIINIFIIFFAELAQKTPGDPVSLLFGRSRWLRKRIKKWLELFLTTF